MLFAETVYKHSTKIDGEVVDFEIFDTAKEVRAQIIGCMFFDPPPPPSPSPANDATCNHVLHTKEEEQV